MSVRTLQVLLVPGPGSAGPGPGSAVGWTHVSGPGSLLLVSVRPPSGSAGPGPGSLSLCQFLDFSEDVVGDPGSGFYQFFRFCSCRFCS